MSKIWYWYVAQVDHPLDFFNPVPECRCKYFGDIPLIPDQSVSYPLHRPALVNNLSFCPRKNLEDQADIKVSIPPMKLLKLIILSCIMYSYCDFRSKKANQHAMLIHNNIWILALTWLLFTQDSIFFYSHPHSAFIYCLDAAFASLQQILDVI